MDVFRSLDVSASGLSAQRTRLEAVASNLANAQTTRTAEGGPYRRRLVVMESVPTETSFESALSESLNEVRAREVQSPNTGGMRRFEPDHPDAGPDGFVTYPDVNPIEEMVDLMAATRSYEANATAVETAKKMFQQSLDLAR
jgi:flagellar basal-body rod protein FlgC